MSAIEEIRVQTSKFGQRSARRWADSDDEDEEIAAVDRNGGLNGDAATSESESEDEYTSSSEEEDSESESEQEEVESEQVSSTPSSSTVTAAAVKKTQPAQSRPLTKKEKQELKKKELENLDELLADFGVKTKLTEETEGGLASPSAHVAAAGVGAEEEDEADTSKGKKQNKKKKRKTPTRHIVEEGEAQAPSTHNGEEAVKAPENVAALLKAKLATKKKKAGGVTAAKAVASKEAQARAGSKKVKDKKKFNEMPIR